MLLPDQPDTPYILEKIRMLQSTQAISLAYINSILIVKGLLPADVCAFADQSDISSFSKPLFPPTRILFHRTEHEDGPRKNTSVTVTAADQGDHLYRLIDCLPGTSAHEIADARVMQDITTATVNNVWALDITTEQSKWMIEIRIAASELPRLTTLSALSERGGWRINGRGLRIQPFTQ